MCAKSEDRESEVEKIAATQPMCEDVKPVSQGADDDQSAEVQKPKRQRKSVGKKADAESGATPEQSNNNDEDKSQRADAENPEKETKADTKKMSRMMRPRPRGRRARPSQRLLADPSIWMASSRSLNWQNPP